MRKGYLVWIRLENDTEDRIRGFSLNYLKAERMADNIAFFLRVFYKKTFTYGVKSYIHGSTSCLDLVGDDGCASRWGPESFEEVEEIVP